MIRIAAINSKYVHTLLSPYYLAENSGHSDDIDIVQTNINVSIDRLTDIVLDGTPKAIALPTYIFNVNIVKLLIKRIRQESPDTLIILGGPEVSYEYEEYIDSVDCIITGEGERAFRQVCDCIAEGRTLPKVIVGETMSLSDIVSPYSARYFADMEGKIAYFEASRGCPFSCAYCMSGGSRLRTFSLERVFCELNKFKGKNIRVLKFVDRTFNANNKFACEILRYLLDNKEYYQFCFHFEIAGDLITDEFLDLVSSAPSGYFQFEIGVQSFNADTLRSVVRVTDTDKVTDRVRKLITLGNCHVHTDLIAGLPYEDIESFKRGFNKLYDVGSDMLQLGFLKVLRGSRLKGMLDSRYEYSSSAPYEIISTPYLSARDISELKTVEAAVDKYHNTGLFERTLEHYIGDSPYDFFLELGKRMGDKTDLFDRIGIMYGMLTETDCEWRVRGIMTIDYLSHNNSRVLPSSLKTQYNSSFARILRELDIDKKRYYAVKLDINPYTYEREDWLVVSDCGKEKVCLEYIDLQDNYRV